MEMSPVTSMVPYGALVALLLFFLYLYATIVLKSERIRRKLRVQGIKGPPPSFLYGNLPQMQKIQFSNASKPPSNIFAGDFAAHDYTSTLFPFFEKWRTEYGRVYTYSTGMRQHLYVNQPELVKEMNGSMSLDLGKPSYLTKKLAPLLGNGITRSNGLLWAHQRKVIAPEFYMDKVKGMVGLMVDSAHPMLKRWEKCIEGQEAGMAADVRVDEDLRGVSADVLSRACFGGSYSEGKHIFSKLRSLQQIISNQSVLFDITSLGFSTGNKRKEIDSLEREIESLIWNVVKGREHECSSERDLLQLILDGAVNHNILGNDVSKRFIVDNCKTIYFAGHESTAVAASWCLMLLALHPEWQASIRTELAQVCKDGFPEAETFLHLKTVTMVIQEALRLYPPAAFVSREALKETRVGNILVPKGVCLWTLIPTLHRDPEIWGPDANEFKPERFDGGISSACKVPHAYIPFGVGPRLCLGKNFAMAQLKILLSLIVSKFSFSLSPRYRHSPAYRMIVEPGNGVHILIQKI